MLPSKKGMCPAIIRIDGGLLRELGTTFLTILGKHYLPEGSVILIGSLSHLMEDGRVGYAKALVTEHIRFSKAIKNTVHVVPFVPPPMCVTNDPELMRAILDISGWLDKSQKWKLTDYYDDLSCTSSPEETGKSRRSTPPATSCPRAWTPTTTGFICATLGTACRRPCRRCRRRRRRISSPTCCSTSEKSFKWKLDPEPVLERDFPDFRQTVSERDKAGRPSYRGVAMPTVSQRPLLISGRKSVHHRGRVEDHHRVCGHTSSNSEGKTGAAGGGRAGHPVVYGLQFLPPADKQRRPG